MHYSVGYQVRMNRNRLLGGRDKGGRGYGGGDGLLGEGPGFGGSLFEPPVNSHMNQLVLAQHLLQQQAALGGGGFGGGGGDYGRGGGDYGRGVMDYGLAGYGGIGPMGRSLGNVQYLQQGRSYGGGGIGGQRNDRKRRGGDRDRSRGRDSNRSSEGPDIHRSNRDTDKDHDKSEKNKNSNAAEHTEEEEGKVKEKEGSLYCHVCSISVYDEDSFRRHLNGSKHAQRMNSLLTVHQLKSNQLKTRLQAEEHLRKIEGRAAGMDPDYFCKVCNNSLNIPWERHRYSNIHKQRQLQVKRGCGWCNVHDFTNFTEVLKHRETEQHQKNAELYGKKRNGSDVSRQGNRSREDDDDEDLTVPEYDPETAIGIHYIIPVTGYFCKLCNKFYNNEKSAKGAHCQSESHYDKFKEAVQLKIEDREKRLAEEAAATETSKEKMEEESARGKSGKNGAGHYDDEDYDDDLPLEDEDNEGGLLDETIAAGKDTTAESLLNETSANSSFVYLTGDSAKAHIERQLLEDDIAEQSTDFDDSSFLGYTTANENSMILSGAEEDRDEDDSDDDSALRQSGTEKNTAKRGKGRGRGKN